MRFYSVRFIDIFLHTYFFLIQYVPIGVITDRKMYAGEIQIKNNNEKFMYQYCC